MEMGFPEKSGFLIRKIDGLNPAKADINTTAFMSSDGSLYNSARINTRNIVMNLVLLPNPTIEDTRQLLYKYFPIKKPIRFSITTDNRVAEAIGYVESNLAEIFSSQESTAISIVCPNPYFFSEESIVTTFSGNSPSFTFPFSNNSLTSKLLVLGSITNSTSETVYYTGDSEIGVTINIHAIGNATNLVIHNVTTRESMKIDTTRLTTMTGYGIIAGDDIMISTSKGEKLILLVRGGVGINILNCLDKNVDWFHLIKGDNIFAYTCDSGTENLQFIISNQIVYEGI